MRSYRLRLSALLPSSWLNKLRIKGREKRQVMEQYIGQDQATATAQTPEEQGRISNRASSYIPSKDRKEKLLCSTMNTEASPARSSAADELPRRLKRTPQRMATNPCAEVVVSSNCHCHVSSSNGNMVKKFKELEVIPELDKLPPIVTKPAKEAMHEPASNGKLIHSSRRRQSSPRIGIKRVNDYRKQSTAAQRVATQQKKSILESLVVMKSSANPLRDFAESMMEMIVENNIQEENELEELLACYLSLNAQEHHEVIMKVFEHVCFVLSKMKCN
ncbi:transcription repressor OFP3-like [Curcuma longa]|uniref:transcription repressor OFP3-like n=1 Tax=Curcuma longa TaxID=136217 RepID=UPI003D9F5A5F